MKTLLASLTLLTLVAACGADGPPKAPEPTPEPGLSITGQVQIGVAGGS